MPTLRVQRLSLFALILAAACGSARGGEIHPALLARLNASPEPLKAWVFLGDKGVSKVSFPTALQAAATGLSERAIARRSLRRTASGLADERDLPIHAEYEATIKAAGVTVLRRSRWANAVSVRVNREQLHTLAAFPFVSRLEPVRAGRSAACIDLAPQQPGGYGNREFHGLAAEQLAQIGLTSLHARGLTGTGVVVGVLDTGFRRDHAAFNYPGRAINVIAERDFINDDFNTGFDPGDPDGQYDHGTLILGCIGAYLPNSLVGGAFDASFILCKSEDITSETPIEEDNYVEGLEFIEMQGGDVATSSLGYIDWYTQSNLDGLTAVTTIAVNVATLNGLHCCTAAGNGGHDENPATSTLIAPADAFRVITCGSGRLDFTSSPFTSDGPTADGRVKPEILARGSGTWTVTPSDPATFSQASGTSLSTPLVAAAVACLVQAHPDWTVDQMREALFLTGSDYATSGLTDPLFVRGYGFVNAAAAVAFSTCDADVNCDGNLDGFDVQAAEQAVGGSLTDFCQADADFNADGNLDGFDVQSVELAVGGGPCP